MSLVDDILDQSLGKLKHEDPHTLIAGWMHNDRLERKAMSVGGPSRIRDHARSVMAEFLKIWISTHPKGVFRPLTDQEVAEINARETAE